MQEKKIITLRIQRDITGIFDDESEYYMYKTGRYLRETLNKIDESNCVGYRVIPVKNKVGRKILLCIRKDKGKRGGKTIAISLLRDIKKTRKAKEIMKKNAVIIKRKG